MNNSVSINSHGRRQGTLNNIGWSTAAKFSRQLMQFFFQIILARLLDPSDFGLLAMILVFSALADILKNLGLGAAIIQSNNITPVHLSSAFWVNVSAGLGIFLLFQISAGFISNFYESPKLESVVRAYAFIYLIGSFNIVQESLLQKRMKFKRLFVIELIAVFVGGIISLVLAYNGYRVWALVWQYLTITILFTVLIWSTSNWRPSFLFSNTAIKTMKKFGMNLLGHDLLSFVSRNTDNLLIGKILGPVQLGIYSRAYFLMLQPINITNQVLARVMFPVLSKLQDKPEEIKRVYLKSTRLVSFILFPAITYTFVAAEPLILILMGEKWIETAFVLQIFCVYSFADSIGVTIGWIYKSTGRTDIMLRWAVYSVTINLTAIITGLRWGITGVAICYTVSFLVFLWLPGWYFAFRIINLKLSEMLMNLQDVFFISVGSGVVMYFTYLITVQENHLYTAAVVLLTGILAYSLFSFLFSRELFNFFYKGIMTFMHKSRFFSR
jgi:O-antigen/teichoic acid export membrane protein